VITAALIGDTVYLDGGLLYWQAGFEDGSNAFGGLEGLSTYPVKDVR
jgi:hypothetical protein